MNETVLYRTPLDTAAADIAGFESVSLGKGLYRTSKKRSVLTSAAHETTGPFKDLVASWNADLPKDASLIMSISVRGKKGWSPWFEMGRQDTRFSSPPSQKNKWGKVDTDTLVLKRKASAFRFRIVITSPGKPSLLTLAAVTVTDGKAPKSPPDFTPGPWVREIAVSPRSQMEAQDKYKRNICSPTTLAMTLDFWGIHLKTMDVVHKVQDKTTGIFGDWSFNVGLAGALGLEGYVARLDSLSDLQDEIAAGRPVGVSLTYGRGELNGSPIPKTRGHILLVTGFTKTGDVIVRDPAAPERSSVRRVYDRQQFHKVWRVKKDGLSYMISPRLNRKMMIGVPVADLRTLPRKAAKPKAHDPERLSQLLYGETVTVLETKPGWARVLADEQLDYRKGKKWQGYPGWIPAETLRSRPSWKPDSVVTALKVSARTKGRNPVFSLGTRLLRIASGPKKTTVRLLDGRTATLPAAALADITVRSPAAARRGIIKTAELFLGSSYFWGGRSGIASGGGLRVDCSGLTNLAYRVNGIAIPRDAHEQWMKSTPKRRRQLQKGDLIFLTKSQYDRTVTHVMLYTGGEGLIEARDAGAKTIRTTFSERFGEPLRRFANGQVVTDLSTSPSKRRIILFGSYLATAP